MSCKILENYQRSSEGRKGGINKQLRSKVRTILISNKAFVSKNYYQFFGRIPSQENQEVAESSFSNTPIFISNKRWFIACNFRVTWRLDGQTAWTIDQCLQLLEMKVHHTVDNIIRQFVCMFSEIQTQNVWDMDIAFRFFFNTEKILK